MNQDPVPDGFRCGVVALAGRANVGKSTLMNRLVGTKLSIVSQAPQTTRYPVRGVLHSESSQVIFIDTPGIHRPRFRMNEEMVRMSRQALREVDLVAVLVDASEGFGPGDRFVFDLVKESPGRNLLALNKIDRMRREQLLPLLDEAGKMGLFEDLVPVSAKTGENCDRLLQVLAARMPAGPPLFPATTLTDLPERLGISEMIREQVCLQTREEIPHATAVLVDSIDRERKDLTKINATILVERLSHKGILIGQQGLTMKAIGMAARHNLEAFLKTRVHLSLWVKVKEGWRDDMSLLRRLGL
jgi:GTP-binding protein Era